MASHDTQSFPSVLGDENIEPGQLYMTHGPVLATTIPSNDFRRRSGRDDPDADAENHPYDGMSATEFWTRHTVEFPLVPLGEECAYVGMVVSIQKDIVFDWASGLSGTFSGVEVQMLIREKVVWVVYSGEAGFFHTWARL